MSVNNTVIQDGEPVELPEEKFTRVDGGIKFEITSGNGYPGQGGCFYGNGKVHLSNLRAVFLEQRPTAKFSSFSIPFLLLRNVEQASGWFSKGSTVTGMVNPVRGGGLVSVAKFKITFRDRDAASNFLLELEHNLDSARSSAGRERHPHERAAERSALPVHEVFASQFAALQPPPPAPAAASNQNPQMLHPHAPPQASSSVSSSAYPILPQRHISQSQPHPAAAGAYFQAHPQGYASQYAQPLYAQAPLENRGSYAFVDPAQPDEILLALPADAAADANAASVNGTPTKLSSQDAHSASDPSRRPPAVVSSLSPSDSNRDSR